MKKNLYNFLCGISAVLLTFPAYADQAIVNADDVGGSTDNGITIDSDPDNLGGEYLELRDKQREILYAIGNDVTRLNGDNTLSLNYDNNGNGVGTLEIQTGGANVITANNAGNMTVYQNMITNGINNGNDGITNAGAISGVTTLNTSGTATLNAANITNNFDVDGTTTTDGITNDGNIGTTTLSTTGLATLNSTDVTNNLDVGGATTLNNTLSVDSNGGAANGTLFTVDNTAATTTSTDTNTTQVVNDNGITLSRTDGGDTNSLTVGDTQTTTIGGGTFNYGTQVNGGMRVEGDLGVNGSIYALNPSASSGINVGNNGIEVDGGTNTTSLVADSNAVQTDGRAEVNLEENRASIVVYNSDTGNAHGLVVEEQETVLSGGTTSTTLTLNDSGATFNNTDTGGPARVMGVANGISRYDAVNYGQLRDVEKTANAGVATVAAMSNIPTPQAGKTFTLGLGFGNYQSESAVAAGFSANVHENVTIKASYGKSGSNDTFGAGVGLSW